jgi:hypothetical protein
MIPVVLVAGADGMRRDMLMLAAQFQHDDCRLRAPDAGPAQTAAAVSARRGFQVMLGIVAVHDINVGHDERHPERCAAHAFMMGASTANPL